MNGVWLFAFARRGATELLVLSWQALILVSIVWLGAKLCRVKSPALRHQIWLLTLLAVAVLPLASRISRRFPAIQPASPALSSVIDAPTMLMAQPIAQREIPGSPIKEIAKGTDRSSLTNSLIKPILLVAWLAGVLLVLVRLAREQRALQQRCKRAKTTTPQELGIFPSEALMSYGVSLRLSKEIESPLLYGILRPIVLLPADLAEWTTPSERDAMIQHELAHVARLDPLANLFQTVMGTVFFFHPLVRYACRQMSLDRELACDDRVIALGARAEVYAESLLKVAERSVKPAARYQIAFFSTKQILERRVDMILNREGVRVVARHWKGTLCSASLIVMAAWLLIPSAVRPGLAQTADTPAQKLKIVKALGEQKAFDDLIEMALRNPDPELRRLAAVRLTELDGDGSTQALVALYNQTNEPEVKIMLIDALARISEIEPLTKIALSEQNADFRQRALRRLKFLKANSERADVGNWDVAGLAEQLRQVQAEPPPPPPPPRRKDLKVHRQRMPPPPPPRPSNS